MCRSRLEDRVGETRDHGWAVLPGHRHAFNKLGVDGSGKGNIVAAVELVVHGVLYELSDDQLRILAGYEGGYEQVMLEVGPGGADPVWVSASFRAVEIADGLIPTEDYLRYYERGIEEHGLPRDYLAMILQQARR